MSEPPFDPEPERLSVRYAGVALSRNTIAVGELAPSLLALEDLFSIAHGEIGPTLTPPPTLEITGQRPGSFVVDLWLSAGGGLVDLLTQDRATAAANGIGISAPVVGAIGWLIHRWRRQSDEQVRDLGPDLIQVSWADGTTITAPQGARTLIERMDFNRTAGRVFEPLRHQGIDTVEIRTDSYHSRNVRALVTREDLRAFNPAPVGTNLLSENTRVVNVQIESPAFKSGNKWRVNDGLASMWVSLDDRGYAQKVNDGEERFGVGDRLVVLMHDRQLRMPDGEGVTWEHSIRRVVDHQSMPPPDELPFDE